MNESITTGQLILIITITRMATVITNMPLIHINPGNQDVWIMILLSMFYVILLALPVLFLSNKFNTMTIIGYMEKIFGKYIGKVIGISYGLFFTRIAVLYFYMTIQMIRTAFMTELAPIIVIPTLMILCLFAASRGLGVLGKTAEVFGPLIIVSLVFFTVLGLNKMDISVLLPIYKESGFASINSGAIELALFFTDIFILAMNVPQLENKRDLKKIILKFTIYSTLLILMMVVAAQTSLGVEQARHSNYPFLTYVRMVRAYSIFERIESIFLIIWTLSISARVVAFIYISSYVFKEIFNKKDVNFFVYPIGIITAIITYYLADINPMLMDILLVQPIDYIYGFIFKVVIPLMAVMIYFFRRKSLASEGRLSD